MYIDINASPLSVVTTWVINRFHLTLYEENGWRMGGKEITFLRLFAIRASLPEYSDQGSCYNLVHPECSCWKHFLWIVMPLRGMNSRSAHPFFIRIHCTCIWSLVWLPSLLNFSEEEVLHEYQKFLDFLYEIPTCPEEFICMPHLFLRCCSQFLVSTIFTPAFFFFLPPDLASPSYVCLRF